MRTPEKLAEAMQAISEHIADDLMPNREIVRITHALPEYQEGIRREQEAWTSLLTAWRDECVEETRLMDLARANQLLAENMNLGAERDRFRAALWEFTRRGTLAASHPEPATNGFAQVEQELVDPCDKCSIEAECRYKSDPNYKCSSYAQRPATDEAVKELGLVYQARVNQLLAENMNLGAERDRFRAALWEFTRRGTLAASHPEPAKEDRADAIAETIAAHGYLANAEDAPRVAFLIRAALRSTGEPEKEESHEQTR
jgi:hypothetical protein